MHTPLMWLWLWIGVPALLFWLFKRTGNAERKADDLHARITDLHIELARLKSAPGTKPAEPEPAPAAAPTLAGTLTGRRTEPPAAPVPPPLPPLLTPVSLGVALSSEPSAVPAEVSAPPVEPEKPRAFIPPIPPAPPKPAINWEKMIGVKLFAWIGGLLFFLVAAFSIKYSFDNNLISPQLRVALAYVFGASLLVGGLWLRRDRYAVTAQSLCAASVLIFYANTFACHRYYHFLEATPTFAVMALITAVAFGLAVRLNAQVVAVLGLLGGFLTPVFFRSGADPGLSLFAYIALLDIGLIAVVLRQRWNYLVTLACAGTALYQFIWTSEFFAAEKFPTAVVIFLGFAALFPFAHALACRWKRENWFTAGAALAAPAAAFLFAFSLLDPRFRELAAEPAKMFGFVFTADLIVLALAWARRELRFAQFAAGAASFALLAAWTANSLTAELLNWALGLYLVFGVLHSIFPVVVERRNPSGQPLWLAHLFPPVVLLMVLLPLFKLTEGSMLIWPVVLLVDLLAIGLAVLTASLAAIAVVLLLTMVVSLCWILRIPAELTHLPEMLIVIGGFAIFFFVAGIFAGKKILTKLAPSGRAGTESPVTDTFQKTFGDQSLAHLPAMAAVLPFLLLIMMTLRLPLADPSPVFGLGAALTVLLLAVVRIYGFDALAGVGLACAWLLQFVWHENHFNHETPLVPLLWNLGFGAAFFLFPFIFRARFVARTIPWAVSALAWPLQFLIVYDVVKKAWPNDQMGLVPAAFAVPTLLSVVFLVTSLPADAPKRNTQLALFGGVALLFITLIFPIQFSKQWLTIAWALEGAALLWLFHRVPHQGLRIVGATLLVIAFARLALNPAVLEYHPRGGHPILNWWLYSYGLATIALFAAARLAAPPRDRLGQVSLPVLFYSLGTVLAFLLLNIEIADYFTEGTRLQFSFHGKLAEDMTYSLAWGVFAIVLLGAGIWKNLAAPRYAGLALLVVTLGKLFLHDLWRLGGLFRIGSLIGLAVMLMAVSFIYQRFLSGQTRKETGK